MKYQSPQITSFRVAVPEIRGFNRKFLALLIDSLGIVYCVTIVAYECDE